VNVKRERKVNRGAKKGRRAVPLSLSPSLSEIARNTCFQRKASVAKVE
jgi:hypothetical protein